MKSLVLRATRPFPRAWTWLPESLRAQTPLSVLVFLLLLGGLVFLPRNELFDPFEGESPTLHIDWPHAGYWLLSMLVFVALAYLIDRLGKVHRSFRQTGRWGFQATQFLTIAVLLVLTFTTTLGRSRYSKADWHEAHLYIPIALAFSLVAWLATAMSLQLYQRFSHKREVVAEMLRLARELLTSNNGRNFDGYVGHRTPCDIWFTSGNRRRRWRMLKSCLTDWVTQLAFVILRYGMTVLTIVAMTTLLVTITLQSLVLTRLSWAEPLTNWALSTERLSTFFFASVVLGLVACWLATMVRERRSSRLLETVRSAMQDNGAFLVSAGLIIAIGATLADIKYVSTVVLGAPQLVFKWVAFFFLLIWNFQYLVQSALDLRLFDVMERFSQPPRRRSNRLRSRPRSVSPATSGANGSTNTTAEAPAAELLTDGGDGDESSPPDEEEQVDRLELRVSPELPGLERYGISGLQLPVRTQSSASSAEAEALVPAGQDTGPVMTGSVKTGTGMTGTGTTGTGTLDTSHPPAVIRRDDLFSAMIGRPQTHHAGEMMRRDTHRYLASVNFLLVFTLVVVLAGMRSPLFQRDAEMLNQVVPIVSVTIGESNGSAPISRLASSFPAGPANAADDRDAARLAAEFEEIVCPEDGSDSPVIFLAASGGGTRAALYTASVLERLQRMGKLSDVRLMSGASGGCVALGYFLSHYEELVHADPDQRVIHEDGSESPGPWQRFYAAMQSDYIVDSIRGLTQVRTLRGQPLGVQLAESFARHWKHGERPFSELTAGSVPSAGSLPRPGFLVVCTLAGVSPAYTRDPLVQKADGSWLIEADAYHSGGRLLWTNFDVASDWFPPTDPQPNSADDGIAARRQLKAWRFDVISHARVELSRLVALSANFPPVFQNAGIRVRGATPESERRTYWITDGGVVDNRGILPMMYAVEGMLKDRAAGQRLRRPILFVVADAGRVGNRYSQDRGVSAASAAGTELANQLIREKLNDIRHLVDSEPANRDWTAQRSVQYHYLPMPHALRFSDAGPGFGTHWMPDWSMTVTSIREQEQTLGKSVSIGRRQLIELMRWFGGRVPDDRTDPQVRLAVEILEENDRVWSGPRGRMVGEIGHRPAWQMLEQSLEVMASSPKSSL